MQVHFINSILRKSPGEVHYKEALTAEKMIDMFIRYYA